MSDALSPKQQTELYSDIESIVCPKILQRPNTLPDINSSNTNIKIFNIVNGNTTIFPSNYGILIYFPTSWSNKEKILLFIGHTNSGIWTNYVSSTEKGKWVKI